MTEECGAFVGELACRILSGDADAEAELAAWCRPRLVRQLRRWTGNDAVAADLTQEALLIGIIRLRSAPLADPAGAASFLSGIAAKLMLNDRRKTRRRRTGDAVTSSIPDRSPDPLDVILARERRQIVVRAIEAMQVPRDRDLVRRFYLDSEPKESIARAHGLDAPQFDRVLFRARQRLRETVRQIFAT